MNSHERVVFIVDARDKHGKTLAEIGAILGIGKERVRQIYWRQKIRESRNPDTIDSLPTRVFNCLQNFGLKPNATKDDVLNVLPEIRMGSKVGGQNSIKNLGVKSLEEIEKWVGVETEPRHTHHCGRHGTRRFCQFCGCKLTQA